MAAFTINNDNKADYIQKDRLLLDAGFLPALALPTDDEILIENINDDQLILMMTGADLSAHKVTLKYCRFKEVWVSGCKFGQLLINDLTLGDEPPDGHVNYLFIVEKTDAETFWIFDSTLYQGFLVRKNCNLKSLRIDRSVIYNNLSFANSKTETLEVEGSTVEFIRIADATAMHDDHPLATEIEKINIFRTELLKGIDVYDGIFSVINLHGIRLLRSDQLTNYQNLIRISAAESVKTLQSIRITECDLQAPIVISFNDSDEFVCNKTRFDRFRVNFWAVKSWVMADCQFNGQAYWGFANRAKTIEQYVLRDCDFSAEYNFNDTTITGSCILYGCTFQKYPSFFSGIRFSPDCTYDFSFSRLTNLVFDTIRFQRFSFLTMDAAHAEFRECRWEVEKGWFYTRYLVNDEKTVRDELSELIKVKDIYAKLKDNFLASSDFISYGRFLFSEQEIKRRIARKSGNRLEAAALWIHRNLSSYGENFIQPLVIIAALWLLLTIVFIFTGFYANEQQIQFTLAFDCKETGATLSALGQSAVFSLKNLVPFPTSTPFFVYTTKAQGLTQTLELVQKIANLVLFGSFTAALLRYIKK